MIRGLATVIALLLLSGCGSSGGGATSSSPTASPSVSTSPGATAAAGATYFTRAESDAINAVAGPAQAAARRATTRANESRCNRLGSKGYSAWRACWHALLDPYSQKLLAIATELRTLQEGVFTPACIGALRGAEHTFQGYSGQVRKLLAGIDNNQRAAQTRAMNTYDATVKRIEGGYLKPAQAITNACYSPEQLKKLNSKASPSPTP